MSKTIDQAFLDAFEGTVLSIDRLADFAQGGYVVRLVLFVPDSIAQDEMDVYRRIAKAVNIITTKEPNNVREG